MSSEWEKRVKEPEARSVFEALADAQWNYRTLEGLERSTGLARDRILEILDRYADLIRKTLVPDEKGRDLYTLVERGPSLGEVMETFKTAVTKSSRKKR